MTRSMLDDASGHHVWATRRLAQALHHRTDHRSRIRTALTTLGVEPPLIDVREFGLQAGRSCDLPPAS